MKVYPNKGQVQAQKVMIGYLHKVYIHTLSNRYLIFFWLESIIKECKCGRLVKTFFFLENWKSTTTFFTQLAKKSAQPLLFHYFLSFSPRKKIHFHFFSFFFFAIFFCTKPHTSTIFNSHHNIHTNNTFFQCNFNSHRQFSLSFKNLLDFAKISTLDKIAWLEFQLQISSANI